VNVRIKAESECLPTISNQIGVYLTDFVVYAMKITNTFFKRANILIHCPKAIQEQVDYIIRS
jgi:hypothetical protein